MASVKCGDKFGKWTVIGEERYKKANGHWYWTCRCDCGTEKDVLQGSLLYGGSRQCRKCSSSTAGKKHGRTRTPEYRTWTGMRARCNKQDHHNYHNYGARGIRVCERWNDSFVAFWQDMGPRPTSKHTLERLDNDGDYCPENCVWADQILQHSNRRDNRFITVSGVTMTIAGWSRHLGIWPTTIKARLDRGWTDEDAVTRPLSNDRRSNNRFVVSQGLKMTVSQWSRYTGISRATIFSRLRSGWSDHDVVTVPVAKYKRRK